MQGTTAAEYSGTVQRAMTARAGRCDVSMWNSYRRACRVSKCRQTNPESYSWI